MRLCKLGGKNAMTNRLRIDGEIIESTVGQVAGELQRRFQLDQQYLLD